MRLALAQIRHGVDKKDNLDRMIELIDKKGAECDLIVFPETCMGLAQDGESLRPLAEDIKDGEFATALMQAARRNNVHVCACLWEDSGTDKVYNTAVVYGPEWDIAASYRKIHLFDALSVTESDTMLPGDALPPVFEICGVKCSLAICYDLRFPEVFRSAALRGAELFIVPAAWYKGENKREQLMMLASVRALENTAYCAVADMCGGSFTGASSVYDPYGLCAAMVGAFPSVGGCDISVKRVMEIREKLPCLNNLNRKLFY